MAMYEKAFYLKGLADGLDLDLSQKSNRLLCEMVNFLKDMSKKIDELEEKNSNLDEEVALLDHMLSDVSEFLEENYDELCHDCTCEDCNCDDCNCEDCDCCSFDDVDSEEKILKAEDSIVADDTKAEKLSDSENTDKLSNDEPTAQGKIIPLYEEQKLDDTPVTENIEPVIEPTVQEVTDTPEFTENLEPMVEDTVQDVSDTQATDEDFELVDEPVVEQDFVNEEPIVQEPITEIAEPIAEPIATKEPAVQEPIATISEPVTTSTPEEKSVEEEPAVEAKETQPLDDEDAFIIECPACGTPIALSDEQFETGFLVCPNCKRELELDFDEE